MRVMDVLKLIVLVLVVLPFFLILSGAVRLGVDYRTADRSSAGFAPDPAKSPEAVVQVYAARALNWRGIFGVHTWIATKPEDAQEYHVHHVIGWRVRRNLPGVVSQAGVPDGRWFGNLPELLADVRGPRAAAAIPKILSAVESYPYANDYQLWPGPNSNTFTAHVARHAPELNLELPATAVGKDFTINGSLFDRAPSGSGYQLSLYGLAGILVAQEEGVELNLLGLSFGIDFSRPALKLPFVGRLGFSNGVHPNHQGE